MKKFKKIHLFIVIVCSFTICNAQNKVLDSLIQKIDNTDAYIVMTKTTSPRTKGEVTKQIIEIGKSATCKLVQVLEDKNKGIVAHFLLSEIWKETWNEEPCCSINDYGTYELVTINGLEIKIEGNELSATSEHLLTNKLAWKAYCPV
jgi:hypothetical protein